MMCIFFGCVFICIFIRWWMLNKSARHFQRIFYHFHVLKTKNTSISFVSFWTLWIHLVCFFFSFLLVYLLSILLQLLFFIFVLYSLYCLMLLSRITVACIQTLTVSKPLWQWQFQCGSVHMACVFLSLHLSRSSFLSPLCSAFFFFWVIIPTTSYKDPLTSINLILFLLIFFSFHSLWFILCRVFFFLVPYSFFVLWQQIYTDKIILFDVTNVRCPNTSKALHFFFFSVLKKITHKKYMRRDSVWILQIT